MKAWKLICIVLVATIVLSLANTGNTAHAHLKNLKRRSGSSSSRSESSVVPSSAIKNRSSLLLYGSGKSSSKVGVNNTRSRSSESENTGSALNYSTRTDVSTASSYAPKNGNVLTALANSSYIWSFFVLIAYISI